MSKKKRESGIFKMWKLTDFEIRLFLELRIKELIVTVKEKEEQIGRIIDFNYEENIELKKKIRNQKKHIQGLEERNRKLKL